MLRPQILSTLALAALLGACAHETRTQSTAVPTSNYSTSSTSVAPGTTASTYGTSKIDRAYSQDTGAGMPGSDTSPGGTGTASGVVNGSTSSTNQTPAR